MEKIELVSWKVGVIDWELSKICVLTDYDRNRKRILIAMKEDLILIRNIEASGQTLADKEREAGVTFDEMSLVFTDFIKDVWLMRESQKDVAPNLKQLLAYEKEVDETLAILVRDNREPAMQVLGQEGEDYQLSN
jgi:hypothetical protein